MKLIRIIPILLIKDNFLVKGENFSNHKYVEDIYNAVKIFSEKKAHEIILLDIYARKENRTIEFDLIKKIKKEIFIPLCVGGGFTKAEQVDMFIGEGVEKISINSKLQDDYKIIESIAKKFGSQSVVVSIDVRKINNDYIIYHENNQKKSNINLLTFIKDVQNAGAGEIILTSIDNEGKRKGYDLELYKKIQNIIEIPLIANGGAGSLNTIDDLLKNTYISSCAVGSSFVFFGDRKAVLINYPTSEQIEKIFKKYE